MSDSVSFFLTITVATLRVVATAFCAFRCVFMTVTATDQAVAPTVQTVLSTERIMAYLHYLRWCLTL